MKKLIAICIILLTAELSFGQESIPTEFLMNLNDAISKFDFSDSNHHKNGFLFLPSLFVNRKHQIYATFGFVLPQLNEKKNQDIEDNTEEHMPNTLLNAAFILRYRKSSIILFLEYRRDDSWGLSIKLKF